MSIGFFGELKKAGFPARAIYSGGERSQQQSGVKIETLIKFHTKQSAAEESLPVPRNNAKWAEFHRWKGTVFETAINVCFAIAILYMAFL
ncbi:hypothetical protein NWF32_17745 [Pseudomonas qingdaonensis]|nr:hypothetical protein [Pseudomonas qingdaonensis]